jgi:hypothetical protein
MPKKLTTQDFIERIVAMHGNKYDYSETVYINSRTKVVITCRTHGNFEIKADNALAGQGCAECARDKHKLTTISSERLNLLKEKHRNKYSYPDLKIDNGKITIVCPIHGHFEQSIHQHEYGHGCPDCGRIKSTEIKKKICRTCKQEKSLDNYKPRYKSCNSCVFNNSIEEKKCQKCELIKPSTEFPKRKGSHDGLRNLCKDCYSEYRVPINRTYRQENKKILRKKDLIYRKERAERDDLYKATLIARTVIRKAITRGGYKKNSRTESILGCDYLTFKQHIESMFVDGMSWQNRNEWHIDHIIPISSAMDETHLLRLNHFTNLQPLWIQENLIKSNTIV